MPSRNRSFDAYGNPQRRCTYPQHHESHPTVWLPETAEFFSITRAGRVNSWCRPCANAHSRATRSTGNRAARRSAERGRRFGIELEFIGDRRAVVAALQAEGLPVRLENYNHTTRRHWKVVTDASVMGGGELVSPVLRGAEGRRQVMAACRALQAAGATVNRSTGLHVHHEVRDLSVAAFAQLARNWFNSQVAIDGLVAASRRQGTNPYCRPLTRNDVAAVETLSSMERTYVRRALYLDRYRTLNFMSYGKYGTVEVRQHQGTTNGAKVMAWVAFGQAMITAAVQGEDIAETNAADLLATLGGMVEEGADRETLAARARFFSDQVSAPAQPQDDDGPVGCDCDSCRETYNRRQAAARAEREAARQAALAAPIVRDAATGAPVQDRCDGCGDPIVPGGRCYRDEVRNITVCSTCNCSDCRRSREEQAARQFRSPGGAAAAAPLRRAASRAEYASVMRERPQVVFTPSDEEPF